LELVKPEESVEVVGIVITLKENALENVARVKKAILMLHVFREKKLVSLENLELLLLFVVSKRHKEKLEQAKKDKELAPL
jgi:hypothetical protein